MSETFVKFDVLQQLKFQDKPILRTYPILRGCYPPQPPAYVDNTFRVVTWYMGSGLNA